MLTLVLTVLALAMPYVFEPLVLSHLSKEFTVDTPLGSPRTVGALVMMILACVIAVGAFVASVFFRRSARRQRDAAVLVPEDALRAKRLACVALAAEWLVGVVAAFYTFRVAWVLFWFAALSHW